MSHHRSSRNHSIIRNGYGVLTIAVFPVVSYLLQLISKISPVAVIAAGVLVVIKVFIELVEWHHRHTALHTLPAVQISPRSLHTYIPQQPRIVIAKCFLCFNIRALHPYMLTQGQTVGICEQCHRCVTHTIDRI